MDERDDLPHGVCPRCGDVLYDLDLRRGGEVRCYCGARLIIVQPRELEERPSRLPD
ncbi:MAG: hypothetical protein HY690_10085 [Chloroflexi bacterium]|nr:hypothetical protein [Chloroflexota bacterium]